ncbi:MAG: NYN domain-containing protein [Proteobacteria bacterium]|nr:NYN domain-containing protein [Pseudomonadota bacterium]
MMRVVAYIDGFNLYFGLKESSQRKYYWLDLHALATALLKPGQTLTAVHFFTTRIRDNGHNAPDRQRQNMYLDALAERGVSIHEGHYLRKTRQCRQCGATWDDYEEKMTDVNIATKMLCDAQDDLFDVALLISGDSDLTSPVQLVRSRFPAKRVIIAFPPKRHSAELKKFAHGFLTIGLDKLRASQLPVQVPTRRGHILHRPKEWQ